MAASTRAPAPRALSALAQLAQLSARDLEAYNDPRWGSVLPWRRRRAERRLMEASTVLRTYLLHHRNEVIDEVIADVGARYSPSASWQRVDHQRVLKMLPATLNASPGEVVERIFHDARAELDPDDVRMLEECAGRLPAEVYASAAALPLGAMKPRNGGPTGTAWLAGLQADLREAYRDHAALLRPVTLWRGEHPNSAVPDFAAQMQSCMPGDVIERGMCNLPCTTDPAIAANHEFAWGRIVTADHSASDGWVLRIRTEHAIYIGSRDKMRMNPDGVVHEREAVLFAPRLRVEQHHEVLVDGMRGLQRVHIIDCTAPALSDIPR